MYHTMSASGYSESHPARGGWIEIPCVISIWLSVLSHPARGGWIEINVDGYTPKNKKSHPARGGWIEIALAVERLGLLPVPPRKGWVD